MSHNAPRPPAKPVWPIVVACLVLVIGIALAAVFVGINLSDSDEKAAGRDPAPAYVTVEDGASDDEEETPADQEKQTGQNDSKTPDDTGTTPDVKDEAEPPDDEPDPATDPETTDPETTEPPPDEQTDEVDDGTQTNGKDPRLVCRRGASTVLTTRTATFGASICRTADGDHVYRGLSENIADGLHLYATFDDSRDAWVATNQAYEYLVNAETGRLIIRNRESGEVYGNEPAVRFKSN